MPKWEEMIDTIIIIRMQRELALMPYFLGFL